MANNLSLSARNAARRMAWRVADRRRQQCAVVNEVALAYGLLAIIAVVAIPCAIIIGQAMVHG